MSISDLNNEIVEFKLLITKDLLLYFDTYEPASEAISVMGQLLAYEFMKDYKTYKETKQ